MKAESEKKIKRVSVALTEEVYQGVKALAALSSKNLNDYVYSLLAEEVAKNDTSIQQMLIARRSYEESIKRVTPVEKQMLEND